MFGLGLGEYRQHFWESKLLGPRPGFSLVGPDCNLVAISNMIMITLTHQIILNKVTLMCAVHHVRLFGQLIISFKLINTIYVQNMPNCIGA